MAHINLLPWRETQRKQREQQFIAGLVAAAVLALLLLGGSWFVVDQQIQHQQARNKRIKAEIKLVEKQIKEINELETIKSRLLSRMEVIEALQASRSQAVHFFEEITNTLPEGVYLTEVDQNGTRVTIKGIAESNSRVSQYMNRLDQAEWLGSPQLVVINTRERNQLRVSEFTLKLRFRAPKPVDETTKNVEAAS